MADYDETSSFASPLGRRVGYGAAESSSLRTAMPEPRPSSRRVVHRVQPSDTIQGIAVKYNVTVDELRRVNKLYTNDSIWSRATLLVPATPSITDDDRSGTTNGVVNDQDRSDDASGSQAVAASQLPAGSSSARSGEDFLSRMDSSLQNVVSQLKTIVASEAEAASKSSVTASDWGASGESSLTSASATRRSGSTRLSSRVSSVSSIVLDLRDTPEPVVRSSTDIKDRMERKQDELFQL